MTCPIRDELKEKYGHATLAQGKYDESLKGIARTIEHIREVERLEKETNESRRALLDHEEKHGCNA